MECLLCDKDKVRVDKTTDEGQEEEEEEEVGVKSKNCDDVSTTTQEDGTITTFISRLSYNYFTG